MSQSSESHRRQAAGRGPIPIAILTVSDSRTPETDGNGEYLRGEVVARGHEVSAYRLLPDEVDLVKTTIGELAGEGRSRVLLVNGGTGIARRDRTFDALHPLLEREIPGFGELFRMLSYQQVGSAAMLSRATAGVHRGMLVFSIPGSPAAVRLAWEKLIAPELEHLVWELER
jgi:molybdopterin adenylyltransferase